VVHICSQRGHGHNSIQTRRGSSEGQCGGRCECFTYASVPLQVTPREKRTTQECYSASSARDQRELGMHENAFAWGAWTCFRCLRAEVPSTTTEARADRKVEELLRQSHAIEGGCWAPSTWKTYEAWLRLVHRLKGKWKRQLLPMSASVQAAFHIFAEQEDILVRDHGNEICYTSVALASGHSKPSIQQRSRALLYRFTARYASVGKTEAPDFVSRCLLFALAPATWGRNIDLRDAACVVLGFFAMRRISECVVNKEDSMGLRRKDLQFIGDNSVRLWIRRAKNDKFGGMKGGIPDGPRSRPVFILKEYAKRLQNSNNSDEPFIQATRGAAWSGKPMQFRPRLKYLLQSKLGYSQKRMGSFSSHSLRRGGCDYAQRCGASVDELKAMCCWKSGDTVLLYCPGKQCRDSLAVSKLM